jgi:hypothetical protein
MDATLAARLARAVALGTELVRIDQDSNLHRLSRAAWIDGCLRLGRWLALADLQAARERLTVYPNLALQVTMRARLWADRGQDRPALYRLNGDHFPAAYDELQSSGLTLEQLSAVASFMAQELLADTDFGTLDDHADLKRLEQPLLDELRVLDRELAPAVRLVDLIWQRGRPHLKAGEIIVEVSDHTAHRLASTIARVMVADARRLLAA